MPVISNSSTSLPAVSSSSSSSRSPSSRICFGFRLGFLLLGFFVVVAVMMAEVQIKVACRLKQGSNTSNPNALPIPVELPPLFRMRSVVLSPGFNSSSDEPGLSKASSSTSSSFDFLSTQVVTLGSAGPEKQDLKPSYNEDESAWQEQTPCPLSMKYIRSFTVNHKIVAAGIWRRHTLTDTERYLLGVGVAHQHLLV